MCKKLRVYNAETRKFENMEQYPKLKSGAKYPSIAKAGYMLAVNENGEIYKVAFNLDKCEWAAINASIAEIEEYVKLVTGGELPPWELP